MAFRVFFRKQLNDMPLVMFYPNPGIEAFGRSGSANNKIIPLSADLDLLTLFKTS